MPSGAVCQAAVAGAVKHVTDHRMEAALANKNLVYLFIFASDVRAGSCFVLLSACWIACRCGCMLV